MDLFITAGKSPLRMEPVLLCEAPDVLVKKEKKRLPFFDQTRTACGIPFIDVCFAWIRGECSKLRGTCL
jgi:hypothetical protein